MLMILLGKIKILAKTKLTMFNLISFFFMYFSITILWKSDYNILRNHLLSNIISIFYLYLFLIMLINYKYRPCILNGITNCLEIHVGGRSKGDINKFFNICITNILRAHAKKKDIVFCSYHFNKKTLKNLFGDAIIFVKPSFTERLIAFIDGNFIYRIKQKPFIKCIIMSEKINCKTIERLKLKLERVL